MFAHGVASGDPLPDAVILWTRVTPTPDATPGSRRGPDTRVHWEISRRPDFGTVDATGTTVASAVSDHTIKIDVGGLVPATTYFYRFRAAGAVSPTGRTRTAPPPGADVARVRFAVVSCSNWEGGFFAAYRHIAADEHVDAVIHLGDYLYEYAAGAFPVGGGNEPRLHEPRHEIVTLADYRIRHGQYKTDPDLQALHAHVPWIVVWDDHESANDAWAGGAQNHDPGTEGDWADRKAASTQAYAEWMPVRMQGSRIYRRLRFGTLAELSMLDLRSYRTAPARSIVDRRTIDDDTRTITGPEQMRWLTSSLTSSPARWQLVGTSVMFAPVLLPPLDPRSSAALTELLGLPAEGVPYNTDQWDGYPADRRRLLETITANGVGNVVFLTGDIHTAWANDVPVAPAGYPGTGSAAAEFVVPSVTSSNIDDLLAVPPRTVSPALEATLRATNRHVRYVELDSHGFGMLDVTGEAARMQWYFLDDPADPRSNVRRAASYRLRNGTTHIEPT